MSSAISHRTPELVRIGPDPLTARRIVLAVHGRGQTPQYLVEHLVSRIADPSISWLLPAAPGGSWYPSRFMEPMEALEPDLDRALARLADVEAEVAGADPERVVWAGFSQGACLVAEYLARGPVRWGGALIFTGGRAGPPGYDLSIAGDFEGMPSYFGVGDADPWVPAGRVTDTAGAFAAAGADVVLDVFDDDAEHLIRDREIDRARRILR